MSPVTLMMSDTFSDCENNAFSALYTCAAKYTEKYGLFVAVVSKSCTNPTFQKVSDNSASFYNTGSIVSLEKISYVSEKNCKIIGLICFVLSISIFCLIDLKSRKSIRPVTVTASVFPEYKA